MAVVQKTTSALRTPTGHIKRSAVAKDVFECESGYPHGRRGYVVDHKVALACGGADSPKQHAVADD